MSFVVQVKATLEYSNLSNGHSTRMHFLEAVSCLFRCLCKIFSSISALKYFYFETPYLNVLTFLIKTNPGLTTPSYQAISSLTSSGLVKIIGADQKKVPVLSNMPKVIEQTPIKTIGTVVCIFR